MKTLPKTFALALLFLFGVYAQTSYAQIGAPYQISGEMVAGGDALELGTQISPDGEHVVYIADQRVDGVLELFSVPISGGTPVRLNPDLIANGGVTRSFKISADSSRVVYVADQRTDDVFELFSVPISGGSVVRLNPSLVTDGDVHDSRFEISADSKRVVYQADQHTNNVDGLFSVPIAGGAAIELNPDRVLNGNVSNFQISADSKRVVYRADQRIDTVIELFSVPIAGGSAVRLNPNLARSSLGFSIGGDVIRFKISANSKHVVYQADQRIDEVDELFSVPIAGGTAIRLNPDLIGHSSVFGAGISADSTQVIYYHNRVREGTVERELFSVPIAGGSAVRLNPDLVLDGNVRFFEISADSERVIYSTDQLADEVGGLFSVPISGGTVTRINDDLPLGAVVRRFTTNSTGTVVVYLADQNLFDQFELFAHTLKDDSFCAPIKARNGNVALICL